MSHPAPERHLVSLPQLWFGVFGAPVVWALQFTILYAAMVNYCYPGRTPRITADLAESSALSVELSVLAIMVAAVAGLVAWKNWRTTRHQWRGTEQQMPEIGEGRTRFMAMSGMMLSTLFLLAILLNGFAMLQYGRCW